ncbi:MAG TPA: 2-oxoacid:acceptor oxidoreductase family protein [Armatimonadota bacterium]|nr:2-oxoacid:acceptor oxidoreductase family protein [Armatimonadota bacterium]
MTTKTKDLLEIRWHGRGGQGAKTAALLLGEALLASGKHMQAFPEYGAERMGAPIQAFNRISDHAITLHCNVAAPDVVVVIDPTLLEAVEVTDGLGPEGTLLVNTPLAPAEVRDRLGLRGRRVYTVDASAIATQTIKRNIPNTPMLGALAKVSGVIELEALVADSRKRLEKKFRAKPEVIGGNLEAMRRGYEEVRGE